jgi:hypothetical protein
MLSGVIGIVRCLATFLTGQAGTKRAKQKASRAKPQSPQRKSLNLDFIYPNDLAFLCALGDFARKLVLLSPLVQSFD